MKTIGITGGVGAGKSTVLAYLEEKYNAFVIQADEVGHIVMAPGQECYQPVINLFGNDVIKNDKTIDRKRVSDVVFEQPDFLSCLNGIIHPAVKRYILKSLEEQKKEGGSYALWKPHFFWKNITRSFVMKYGIFIQMRKSAFSA